MRRAIYTAVATTIATLFALAPATPASANFLARDGVVYDSTVAARCGMLTSSVFFGPGEAGLEIHDYAPLDYIAECMVDGPLADARVAVIGFTDPNGPAELNVQLGADRSNAVIDYLVSQGVEPDRLLAVSLGETTTRGDANAPSAWPTDRRVELWVLPTALPVVAHH